jgi:hypothetical protein
MLYTLAVILISSGPRRRARGAESHSSVIDFLPELLVEDCSSQLTA